jgi:Sec-independent protein translocase protein TatA
MLNLDPAKMLVILVLGLVVVGPERLPGLAKQLSGVWKTVTKYREQLETEVRNIVPDLDLPRIPKSPSAMVTGFVTDLINPASKSAAVSAPNDLEGEVGDVRGGSSEQASAGFVASSAGAPLSGFSADRVGVDALRDDPSMN